LPIRGSGTKNSRATNQSTTRTTTVNSDQVVSASELAKMKFKTLIIDGVFGKLLGNPYIPFYLMIYGARFNGKSSVAMLLANVLAKKGLNVLYVSNEEGVKGSLQEKLLRLNITAPIDFVEDYIPSQFKGYDAVFLDSTQTVGIKPDDFKVLKKRFPNTSFILVFKANKDGTSKGGSDWQHDCDAIMHIENQSATMEKNRFPNGSNETIKIF
jgi:predicted ATP-dependent serine protease